MEVIKMENQNLSSTASKNTIETVPKTTEKPLSQNRDKTTGEKRVQIQPEKLGNSGCRLELSDAIKEYGKQAVGELWALANDPVVKPHLRVST
jgi:hypothetical protein